jgi:hypothetical protein
MVWRQSESLARLEQNMKKVQDQNEEFRKLHEQHRQQLSHLTQENDKIKCQCSIS